MTYTLYVYLFGQVFVIPSFPEKYIFHTPLDGVSRGPLLERHMTMILYGRRNGVTKNVEEPLQPEIAVHLMSCMVLNSTIQI